MNFNGKTILIGVSGGIAAYKSCELVSLLVKSGADVHVMMTKNAREFVAPLTFETLSGNRAVSDTFERNFPWEVEHISLAKKASFLVIAPATANVIAKLAYGLADDFLTTTALACKCPTLIAPAMNTAMLQNPATQSNIAVLQERGAYIIYGGEGRLACGDTGSGRMAEPSEIFAKIAETLCLSADFKGKKVVVTAGGTSADIDGVRCLTNYSSGKMGIAIAEAAQKRGADVTLITGRVTVPFPAGIKNISALTTQAMYEAVMSELPEADYVIKAAAPCDYVLAGENTSSDKLKSDKITLTFSKTVDIAKEAGKNKGKTKLIIFCAEKTDLIARARQKMAAKNADMVIANDISASGAGFASDTNIVSILTASSEWNSGKLPKTALADIILDKIKEV